MLKLTFAVLPLLLGLTASSAFGQTNWTGATGSWFVPGNWSAGVPTSATPTTTVGNGGTAQIGAAGANAGNNLVISGGSTVQVLSGGNLTAGNVSTNGSSLSLGSGGTVNLSGTLGGTGATFLNGGTLRAPTTSSVTNNVTFASSATSTLLAATGQTLTLSDNITVNPSTTIKFGSATDTGTVVFAPLSVASSGLQTYEVVGGTWRAGNAAGFSFLASGSTTVDPGATVDLNDFSQTMNVLSGAGTVRTGVNAATTLTLNGNSNFAGAITGAGQLDVFTGTVVLTGTNTYTGGTTIQTFGNLQLGSGGASGSIVGNVTDNGTLIFNRSDSSTFGGAISGGRRCAAERHRHHGLHRDEHLYRHDDSECRHARGRRLDRQFIERDGQCRRHAKWHWYR